MNPANEQIQNNQIIQPITKTKLKEIEGLIEVTASAPTGIPKDFNQSLKISGGKLYFYDYTTNTWYHT
jgi:hypothetical protein